ncbi:LOW QUALITY PROTEIN: hypothetical protein PHMEG_00016688 [Phytophthora megakarya]|uniref:Uncharacterized protein n=1 Tax=Phytophthora megakarya TaxID=4795 RepID=A0A225W0S3_9STRA|nr:LOW QUALITY PROTEIN: hypothetical protein PHMEG_00016688 [Phytophthora megakarya]
MIDKSLMITKAYVCYHCHSSEGPRIHSSLFAMVPKKDKPIQLDATSFMICRHRLADKFDSNAQFIHDLRRRYPGYAIYSMIAGITDVFRHVPGHADHASAFEGNLPRSSHGILSGMSVFVWTSSPGFFTVFGKDVRHCQRTGASQLLGCLRRFWIFQWVDAIVLIEVDIDDRRPNAGKRLRGDAKLVFGSEDWHEGKFTTRSC